MTQIVAIPCKDRIVVSSDSLVYDTEKKKHYDNKPKIFSLSDSICLMLSGWHLNDPADIVAHICAWVKDSDLAEFGDIIEYVDNYLTEKNPERPDYELWRDDEESEISFMIAGYHSQRPRVCIVTSSSTLNGPTYVSRYTLGSCSEEGLEHFATKFGQRTHKKIQYSDAELAATTIIMKAEKTKPELVGGQQMLWHLRPTGTEKSRQGISMPYASGFIYSKVG